MSTISNKLLASTMTKHIGNKRKSKGVLRLIENSFNTSEKIFEKLTGKVGFNMEELMIGDHEFTDKEGKFPFHFKVVWGTKNLAKWGNPFKSDFMVNDLEGTITIGGLAENVPCKGTLELRYFDAQKIVYTFDFEINGKEYQYIGEKRNIYPWNLPYSHTTCFGEVKEKETDKVISNSITHFRMSDMPEFMKSFKLEKEKLTA